MPVVTPKVSVITPTRNRRRLLCETIESVRAQTFECWEHIIIDDGSDDGTDVEVTRRAEADPRIRLIVRDGDRCGANVCRNIGIRASRAGLIIFLDSDDLLEACCLDQRVRVMERNVDLDFATFQTGVFKERPGDLARQLDADLQGDDLLRFLYFECPWQTTAPTWRRAVLDRLGGFDESLPSWQDVDLHVRAIAASCRYVRFPQIDHHMRWQFEETKISIQQRNVPEHLKAAARLFEKLEHVVRAGPGMNWVRQRALCSLYFFIAERWVAIGRPAEALRLWRTVQRRELGNRSFHVAGAMLLAMQAAQVPLAPRVTHKWKGWVRLRTNPELLPQ